MIETGAEIPGSEDEAQDDDDFDATDFAEIELLPGNVRPEPVTTSENDGVAKIHLDYEEAEIQWSIKTSIDEEDITGIHIHGPSDSEGTAPPIQELLGLKGALRLLPETMSYLMANRTYLNLHTKQFPNGELRGHITMEETSGGSRWFFVFVFSKSIHSFDFFHPRHSVCAVSLVDSVTDKNLSLSPPRACVCMRYISLTD
jgi:CHRD domain